MTCSSFMSGIVDKIHEKINFVYDFIKQKRNGQLNLGLLVSKIKNKKILKLILKCFLRLKLAFKHM